VKHVIIVVAAPIAGSPAVVKAVGIAVGCGTDAHGTA
jgi:hypothetical protein